MNKAKELVTSLAKQAILTNAGTDCVDTNNLMYGCPSGTVLSATYRAQLEIISDSLETSMIIVLNAMSHEQGDKFITLVNRQRLVFRSRQRAGLNLVLMGVVTFNNGWAVEIGIFGLFGTHTETLALSNMTVYEKISVLEQLERAIQ